MEWQIWHGIDKKLSGVANGVQARHPKGSQPTPHIQLWQKATQYLVSAWPKSLSRLPWLAIQRLQCSDIHSMWCAMKTSTTSCLHLDKNFCICYTCINTKWEILKPRQQPSVTSPILLQGTQWTWTAVCGGGNLFSSICLCSQSPERHSHVPTQ